MSSPTANSPSLVRNNLAQAVGTWGPAHQLEGQAASHRAVSAAIVATRSLEIPLQVSLHHSWCFTSAVAATGVAAVGFLAVGVLHTHLNAARARNSTAGAPVGATVVVASSCHVQGPL